MIEYLNLLRKIFDNGEERTDRTGVGTISVFGTQTRYDLSKTSPATTTKKLAWKSVVSELLWFIEGSSDERRLAEILHGTTDSEKKTVWTDNCNKQSKDLGYPNSYSLMIHMIAHVCGLCVGEFIHTIGDAHIYKNHESALREQLARTPITGPTLNIKRKVSSIDDFTMDDFELVNYNPHAAIKMSMAV